MRSYIQYLAISILLLLCVTIAKAQTILSFNFNSFPNSPIRIVADQNVLNNYTGQVLVNGQTDQNGAFRDTLRSTKAGSVKLFVGNTFYQIWLAKGNLTFNEAGGSLNFFGSLAAENAFLYQGKFMQPHLNPAPTAYKKEDYATYVSLQDTLRDLRLTLLKKLKLEQKIPVSFETSMHNESLNASFLAKNQFALLQKIDVATAPKGYFNFWTDFKLLADDPASRNYMEALRDYIGFKVGQKHIGKTVSRSALIREEMLYGDSLLRERPLTNQYLKGEMQLFLAKYYDDMPLIEGLAATFAADYPISAFKGPISKALEARRARQQQKISFTLKNEKGEAVNTESFKGKLVYIDFWGTWCKACLQEMPAAKKLRDHFKGKDVVFLYIDFYDTPER